MNTKLTVLLAAAASASVANAVGLYEVAEIEGVMQDVKSNLFQYIGVVADGTISFSTLPAGVMNVVQAVMAGDEGYTTLYSEIDWAGVNTMITKLPWYSTRLLPEIQSIYDQELATATAGSDLF